MIFNLLIIYYDNIYSNAQMDIHEWKKFLIYRCNIQYLSQWILTEHNRLKIIPIKLQINYIILCLCANRNPLGLPMESWKLIYMMIVRDIKYFESKEYIS